MRYTYYFENDITTESVQELIDVIASIPEIDLFITTPGGSAWAMDILIHAVNQHPDINIYLVGYIASAGTYFLTECTQPVFLHPSLEYILFHQGDRSVEGEFRKQVIDRHVLYEQLKVDNLKWADKFKKLGLTAKEIKRYNEGDDVVLYQKDFDRLKIGRISENNSK